MAKEETITIFCGGGKGKTSAALGAAFKGLAPGSSAYVLQFKSDREEGALLKKFEPEIKLFTFDTESEISFAKKVISSRGCDVLILDEVLSLIEKRDDGEDIILELMELSRSAGISLFLTGSYITDEIANRADYITELSKKK